MYQWLSKRYPIWRDAELLALNVEQAVSRFPSYHKFSLGADLRRLASKVLLGVTHCLQQKQTRVSWVKRLRDTIEQQLKPTLQLAKQLSVFRSFAQFELIAQCCMSVAKQAAHWQKRLTNSLQRRGQNS